MKISTQKICLVGLMTAMTCVLAPISIPLPFTLIPISLTNLVIYFSVGILGWKLATVSYFVYLLIGFCGLPVFSSFTGGASKLFGPTGGYLFGFIFLAMVTGIIMEKGKLKFIPTFVGMITGTAILYIFGTVWLGFQTGMSFYEALWAGVIPFIPGDLVKMIIAALLLPSIEKRLFIFQDAHNKSIRNGD